MSESNAQLKDRVRDFWQNHPCGTKFADAQPGSRRFYELVEQHRYEKEWHIPEAAGFSKTKNLRVLEVGWHDETEAIVPKAGTLLARDGGVEVTTPYDDCVLIMPTRRPKKGETAVRLGRCVN